MLARLFARRYFKPEQRPSLAARLRLLRRYPIPDQERLIRLANDFLNDKVVEGAAGLEVDDEMRRVIAVQACVPILELGLHYYRGWYSVVVYPGGFRVSREYVDEAGVVHETTRDLTGECWDRGPVILSWEEIESEEIAPGAGNVVIHEFAHKLDLLNGSVNGMPPLPLGMNRGDWSRHFSLAFDRLRASLARGDEVPLDPYGASSPGEFFAVASEGFFVDPGPLERAYPDVYRLLRAFYRQG